MGSQLRAIYEAVAAVNVQIDGATVTAWTPYTLQNKVNAAALPLRILTPITSVEDGSNMAAITLDRGVGTATWRIEDLCLLAPAASGRGLIEFAGVLVDYQAEYTSRMLQDAQLMRGGRVTGVSSDAGTYSYVGVDYFAVKMTLLVAETFNL